jgi:hypothetical protein
MVETPEGMLTVELAWLRVVGGGGGFYADMTLYGAGGWKADRRHWSEQFSENPETNEEETLPQVISDWTGMPPVDAEVFVEETVSRWRRSSAFETDRKIGRQSMQLMAAVAVVTVLALVGVAALVWLAVSALT